MKLRIFLLFLSLGCLSACQAPPPVAPPSRDQTNSPDQNQPQSDNSQSDNPNEGRPQSLPTVTLHIGKAEMTTEVASTPKEGEIGLMYRTHLSDNNGMIFLLPTITTATFWMKNTLIPLSVAYIDKDGVILEIHDMQPADPALPDDQLPITRSDSDQVAYALEANLHWFALNGIKPGDRIEPPPSTLGQPSH